MPLFDAWCENDEEEDKKKRLWKLTEKDDGRATIVEGLAETVRSHYDSLDRASQTTSKNSVTRMPPRSCASDFRAERRHARATSARFSSELTEEMLGFGVPIRRMIKDGREVALRGDDFIVGVTYDEGKDRLRLLKGESKAERRWVRPPSR